MRIKRCKNCREIIDYKEWCRVTLNPCKWAWRKKKFCNADCRLQYNHNKKK